MKITLKCAVVLGDGANAITHLAGSTVDVSDKLAAQLVAAAAAVAVAKASPAPPPLPAAPPLLPSDPADPDKQA